MKSILVTGGTSFIGKHVIAQLLEKEYNVKSVNMVGGGIFGNWEYKIDYDKLGVDYHGYDIVDDEVERNKKEFPNYNFSQLDMITDVCRKADLIICREVIQHLSSNQVINSIENSHNTKSVEINDNINDNINDISPINDSSEEGI